ncbi:MAG TPA: acyl-CoA dehydrogenase family protein [Actinomycetota bacterium]|nr:acyl-CoA dehydrogenase family protein [Actinomycetota bacterium]
MDRPESLVPTLEQLEHLSRARSIARDHLEKIAKAGPPGRVHRPLVAALAEHGLLQRLFPEDGQVSARTLCELREGIAYVSPEAETALALQGLGAYPILQSGPPELAGRWIPEVRAGRAVAAFALTEPGAGSDAAALALRAEPDGDGFRLTGEKRWISNAPDADVYTVFARTGEGDRARGVTAFAVAGDAEGLSGEHLELVAPHPIGSLVFDGVPVSRADVLGEPGRGFEVAMRTLDLFRPSVGAFAVGMAQAALDASVAHARERHAFDRPLNEFQAVSHRLADMATKLEAARLLVYRAADLYDGGEPVTQASAMAKLFATEAAQEIVDGAIQVHGARALEKGHLLEHLYREVRATRIYEGTSEIQRNVVARSLFG